MQIKKYVVVKENVKIPDLSEVIFKKVLPPGRILQANLVVNGEHECVMDLEFSVILPDGNERVLVYRDENPYFSFNYEFNLDAWCKFLDSKGLWQFVVRDLYREDEGKLRFVQLDLLVGSWSWIVNKYDCMQFVWGLEVGHLRDKEGLINDKKNKRLLLG